MMDQTLLLAYRNKIRSRFKPEKEKDSKTKTPKNLIILNESVIKDEIKAHQQTKDEWRSNIFSILDTSDEKKIFSDQNESFQFFANSISPIKSKVKDKRVQIQEEVKTESEVKNNDDQTNLLNNNTFMSIPCFFAYERQDAVLRNRKKKIEKEKQILKYFDTNPLSDYIRYGRNDNFNLEQDGLYKKDIPNYLKISNVNKLEQRLYHESGLKWFQFYLYFVYSFLQKYFFSWNKVFHENTKVSESSYQLLPNLSNKTFQSLTLNKNEANFSLLFNINSIIFENHCLYSQENVIASRLISLFNSYEKMRKDQIISILTQKIDSFKVSILNLENYIKNSINLEEEVKSEKMQRLLNYKLQILKCIQNRQLKIKEWRSILLALLSYWEEIENLRKKQGFGSTSVKLCYSEIENDLNESDEAEQLQQLIEEEYTLVIEIEKITHEQNLKEKKNFEDEKKSHFDISNKLDLVEIKNNITKNCLLLDGRVPGEPKFSTISIIFDNASTSFKKCPSHEKRRQLEISKYKYLIEIHVDNRLVGSTLEKTLDCNFIVNCKQSFTIELKTEPKEIRFDLIEKVLPLNRANLVSKSFVPIPETIFWKNDNEANDEKYCEYIEFNSLEKFQVDKKQMKMTSGKIFYLSFWKVDNDYFMIPSIQNTFTGFKVVDLSHNDLKKWKAKTLSILDPNDPDNLKLIEAIEEYENLLAQNPRVYESFHLDPFMSEFEFGELSEILNNSRIRLLTKRWQGKLGLKGVSIPMNEKEISLTMLGNKDKIVDSGLLIKKGVEAKREKALSVLAKVKEKLWKNSISESDGPKSRSDLIIENEIEGLNFAFNLFKPTHNKRPLHPVRIERQKITGKLMSNVEVKVIITILHAFNIPVRVDSNESRENQNEHSVPLSHNEARGVTYESQIRPFIEICFQRQTHRTQTAEGPQPTWNETLLHSLQVPRDDFSPLNLLTITDNININIFDEITVNLENEQSRFEKRWLGSLKIPFSTLYLNSKIEGTFKINKPPILLGYNYDSSFYDIEQNLNIQNTLSNTYLSLFLIIDPVLSLPEPLILKCASIEDEKILHYGKAWEVDLKNRFLNREFKAFAIDLNGKFVLVTRFLRPLKPPELFIQNLFNTDEVMFKLARFVSLIPSIPDSVAIPGVSDVWCSCNQFLDMLAGDEEEHAIFLCNMFLYLGKKCGIILGSGIPEGSTCYVIVWEYVGQDPSIWNPISGEKFNVRDSYLPLQMIGTIFTIENIYGNIQKYDHPNQIDYDLSKTSNWKPFFSQKFPNPGLLSIQPAVIDFEPIDENYVEKLQERLEKHLKESFIRWRRKLPTYFNRTCIQKIKKILPKLEKKVGNIKQSDLIFDLQDIFTAHKMVGFPLNMEYKSIESVTETVFATGVHLIEDQKVDFVLAVYLHPYPCNVLSVWLYVGSLTKEY